VFFVSGASALIFETLWFHQASLAFGSSVWASSLVLAGFMGDSRSAASPGLEG
jgi:spermidine synthase